MVNLRGLRFRPHALAQVWRFGLVLMGRQDKLCKSLLYERARMSEQGSLVPQIQLVILAAGGSTRMRGTDKLLEPVCGQPLLRHVAQLARDTGLQVVVTLSAQHPARAAVLEGLNLNRRVVERADDGMGASLRAGVAAVPAGHAIMVLLADMPDIDATDLAAMLAAYRAEPMAIHRAYTAQGVPGHPVIFPPWARAALIAASGDTGAKAVLQAHADAVRPVTLPGDHATTDLDTPEDWARWRASVRTACRVSRLT